LIRAAGSHTLAGAASNPFLLCSGSCSDGTPAPNAAATGIGEMFSQTKNSPSRPCNPFTVCGAVPKLLINPFGPHVGRLHKVRVRRNDTIRCHNAPSFIYNEFVSRRSPLAFLHSHVLHTHGTAMHPPVISCLLTYTATFSQLRKWRSSAGGSSAAIAASSSIASARRTAWMKKTPGVEGP
jgi:hypothetical protein